MRSRILRGTRYTTHVHMNTFAKSNPGMVNPERAQHPRDCEFCNKKSTPLTSSETIVARVTHFHTTTSAIRASRKNNFADSKINREHSKSRPMNPRTSPKTCRQSKKLRDAHTTLACARATHPRNSSHTASCGSPLANPKIGSNESSLFVLNQHALRDQIFVSTNWRVDRRLLTVNNGPFTLFSFH